MTILAFSCSLGLFLGTVQNLIKMQSHGIYPSKKILKKRAEVLATGGAVCLLLGVLFFIF